MYARTRARVGGLVTGWFHVCACSHVDVSKIYRYMGGKERERAIVKEGGVREEMRKDSFVSSA